MMTCLWLNENYLNLATDAASSRPKTKAGLIKWQKQVSNRTRDGDTKKSHLSPSTY